MNNLPPAGRVAQKVAGITAPRSCAASTRYRRHSPSHGPQGDLMTTRHRSIPFIALAAFLLAAAPVRAQDTPSVTPPPAATPAPATEAPSAPQAPSQNSVQPFDPNSLRAWSLLTESAGPGHSAHDRTQAFAALGTMGSDEHAAKLIAEGIGGHDSDVRVAAILAAGQTRNPHLIPRLQAALDDDDPQVAYTAALTLWKLHDLSGEDLLLAVAVGDRKVKPGLIKASKHKAATDLHSPKTLAMIGVNQGSGFFLGPFGVGLKAIEYAGKSNGAAVVRAATIDQLSQQHTPDVHDALVADLTDDEPAVRAAAAKALGRWSGPDTGRLLLPLFGDNHLAVRLTAAAAYLRALNNDPGPAPNCSTETP
jgi:hypothetical protein